MQIVYSRLNSGNFNGNSLDGFRRHQTVTECWRQIDGQWRLVSTPFTDDWPLEKRRQIAAEVAAHMESDQAAFGAFLENRLVGFVTVSAHVFGRGCRYMELVCLQVSQEYRGRGIGKTLFRMAADAAGGLGADRLYISAHCARETQAFYAAMGCVHATQVNAALAAQEPFDLQLEYTIPPVLTVNGKPYTRVRLLGKGKGGYSWLVRDEEGAYVLKQIHHEPCDYYQFGDKLASELRDYARLQEVGIPIPTLLETDEVQERLLKTYIDGPTAFSLVKRDEMRQDYIDQVYAMCEKLYPAGLNIDYFPTNFVLSEGKLWYIDFECNGYMDQWNFRNWGIRYWSKTPEFLEYLHQQG